MVESGQPPEPILHPRPKRSRANDENITFERLLIVGQEFAEKAARHLKSIARLPEFAPHTR